MAAREPVDRERIHCAICGASDERFLYNARDKMFPSQSASFPAVQCRNCGLVYLNPRPSEAERAAYYGDRYRFTAGRPEQSQSLEHYRPVIEFLEGGREQARHGRHRQPSAPRVLDVGTGNSPFLPEMRTRGWEVAGTEVDASLVEHFRADLGIELYHGELENTGFAGATFDAITIMGVLEHVPDPRRLLEEAARLLRDGGMLALWCFNRSVEARMLGRWWLGFDTPRHLYSFSEQSLGRLLAATGFSVERTYFRPMSYLAYSGVWAAGRLKRRLSGDMRPQYLPGLPRAVELAALPWGTALARLGRSSNIYLFARKRH